MPDNSAREEIHRKLSEEAAKPKPNGHAPREGTAIRLVPYDELYVPRLTDEWLVKKLIPDNSIVLIYGPPGCGKTFLAIDLALSIACGRPVFGRKTKQGRVIYLAVEAGKSLYNRIAAWKGEWDTDGRANFSAVLVPVNLGEGPQDTNTLIALIGAADLLVVDTVARSLGGGDENSSKDMGRFISALDRLKTALGCTVIAVHHTGKDTERGARGHSSLVAAVDTEIQVERRGEAKMPVATVNKQRDGVIGDEFAFTLKSVELGLDNDRETVTSCVVSPSDFVPEKAPVMSKSTRRAFEALKLAIQERGTPQTSEGSEFETMTVQEKTWHEYMELCKEPDGKKTFGEGGTFRSACSRAKRSLMDTELIAVTADGWISLSAPVAPMNEASTAAGGDGPPAVALDRSMPF